MEFWTLLGVALVIYWLWSGSQKKAAAVKQLKNAERQKELTIWEHYESDDIGSEGYELDFSKMRLKEERSAYEGRGDGVKRTYIVRRGANGKWTMRQTDASWEKDLAHVRHMVEETSGRAANSIWRDTLAGLEGGPTWQPLKEELQPSVETAYQRYVRQG